MYQYSSAFEQLVAYQARLSAILDQAEPLMRSSDSSSSEALSRLRWDMVRVLREYQLFKHGTLFDPRIRAGGPQAMLAKRMKDQCVALGEAWQAHVVRWSGQCIPDRWDEYRGLALAMVDRLRTHFAEEARNARILLAADAPPAPERRQA